MALSSTTSRVSYLGDGATASFPVPFRFVQNSHITAKLRRSDATEVDWVEGTHYTLTGAGDAAGGTLTVSASPTDYTPASGETLVIRRVVPLSQTSSFPLGGPFPSTSAESAFDVAAMRDQQLQEQVDRTLRFPVTDTVPLPELPSFSTRANKVLAFDSSGDPTLYGVGTVLGDGSTVTAEDTTAARGLAERFGEVITPRDFGAVGDNSNDDTAALLACFKDGRPVRLEAGKVYRITAALDLRGYSGRVIEGVSLSGSVADPDGFENARPAVILQATANTPILQLSGRGHRIRGLALGYASQQSAASTSAVALELNNVSASSFRDILIYGANTSIGIPQSAYSPATFNAVWNSALDNILSYSASLTHFDLRNYNGGGTNVRLTKLYANGDGALDFSSLGQSCSYVLRGANWSGYEVGAMSIDALTFTERLLDINDSSFTIDTLRFESVNCRKNSDGWIGLGGSRNICDIRVLDVYNCRALLADVSTATYQFRLNATRNLFRCGFLKQRGGTFTAPIYLAMQLGAVAAASDIRFGPIWDEDTGFTGTAFNDGSGLTVLPVREWNGATLNNVFRQKVSTADFVEIVDSAPPTSGTWALGDRVRVTEPGALGRPTEWVCMAAGTPGTWHPIIPGQWPVETQGDADATLTPRTSRLLHSFQTTLTADRTVTLSTTNAWNGCTFRIRRSAAGAFALNVGTGPLIALAQGEWCDVTYNGSAWVVSAGTRLS